MPKREREASELDDSTTSQKPYHDPHQQHSHHSSHHQHHSSTEKDPQELKSEKPPQEIKEEPSHSTSIDASRLTRLNDTFPIGRRRPRPPPASFTQAPVAPLPLWQRVVLSAIRHRHVSDAEERRVAVRARNLQRDLTRYREDVQRREERVRAQQRESRARLGNKLFAAVEKQWLRRGDTYQQLLSVEFDEVKRRHDERRQEDLLRESENLTRRLLDGIFNGAAPSTEDEEEEKEKETGKGETTGLENSLTLLDTQNGARPLRDYQRSALRWMTNLYNNRLNGILADEMGLGKTIQTIALLTYFAEYKNDWGPHLIVVPTTVVLNWKAEFARWAPGLKVLVYIGPAKERHRLRKGWTSEDAFHVCITSYNLIVSDRAVFRRRPWGFLVLDEAHQVRNFMSKKWQALFDLQAEYRLLLTGTPLQNSIMELWSLFHFLLPSVSAFKSNDEFREWFSNPMEDMVTGRAMLNEETVRCLQSLLRPFMLRRLKKDVESQLPSKTEKVVMCRLSRRQRLLYDDYMQLAETRERILRGGAGGVLGVLLALRKVCNHPDMFEERPTVSPVVLDYQSEIVMYVPRVVLLMDNDFGGTYRFQKWRLRIEDVSLPPLYETWSSTDDEESRPMTMKYGRGCDTWLNCTMLHVWFADQPWAARESERADYLRRLSPFNFHWSSEPSCASVLEPSAGELSRAVWNLLHAHVCETQSTLTERRTRTESIQRRRQHKAETALSVWFPTSLNMNAWRPSLQPSLVPSVAERAQAVMPIARRVATYVPRLYAARPPSLHCRLPVSHFRSFRTHNRESLAPLFALSMPHPPFSSSGKDSAVFDGSFFLAEMWPIHIRRCFSFPDKRLIIHDCGKLQFLEHALKQMRREGHRMLIFTQFVHMLNILERFLAIIGIQYLRIDGSTQAERRQNYVDCFNDDTRITCMILSTRSGGIGLNLTGADTVIFYDSDWNPTMDLQAQDRCHRIGQTKPVTIYRLISEHTVEENILQKARERKRLNNVVIRGGQFHAIADVGDTYEDSTAAFAALSDPVRLRSFFHDLDEDATIVDGKEAPVVDMQAEMRKVEDEEDQAAQRHVEEELRAIEEQRRHDEAELDEEDEHDADEEGRGDAEDNGAESDPLRTAINHNSGDATEEMDAKRQRVSPMVLMKRRDVIRRLRSPLDRLLSQRFGTCHLAEARERYERLCEKYAANVSESEMPAFTAEFHL